MCPSGRAVRRQIKKIETRTLFVKPRGSAGCSGWPSDHPILAGSSRFLAARSVRAAKDYLANKPGDMNNAFLNVWSQLKLAAFYESEDLNF